MNAFVVVHFPVDRGHVQDGDIGVGGRPGGGQPAAGFHHPEQDIGQGVAHFLSTEVRDDDGCDPGSPWQKDGRTGVDDAPRWVCRWPALLRQGRPGGPVGREIGSVESF